MPFSRNIETRVENVHFYHVVIKVDIFCAGRHVYKTLLFIPIFRVYINININNYFIKKITKDGVNVMTHQLTN